MGVDKAQPPLQKQVCKGGSQLELDQNTSQLYRNRVEWHSHRALLPQASPIAVREGL